jgi:hypothetical protein
LEFIKNAKQNEALLFATMEDVIDDDVEFTLLQVSWAHQNTMLTGRQTPSLCHGRSENLISSSPQQQIQDGLIFSLL